MHSSVNSTVDPSLQVKPGAVVIKEEAAALVELGAAVIVGKPVSCGNAAARAAGSNAKRLLRSILRTEVSGCGMFSSSRVKTSITSLLRSSSYIQSRPRRMTMLSAAVESTQETIIGCDADCPHSHSGLLC